MMKYKIFFKLHSPAIARAGEECTIVDAETQEAAKKELYDRLEVEEYEWLEITEIFEN